MEKKKALRWEQYGLYKLASRAEFSIVDIDGTMENPCPHAIYKFKGKKCLSLKHVLVS